MAATSVGRRWAHAMAWEGFEKKSATESLGKKTLSHRVSSLTRNMQGFGLFFNVLCVCLYIYIYVCVCVWFVEDFASLLLAQNLAIKENWPRG